MSWYIGTREEVEAYNQKVNEAKQYKGSITRNWANSRQHPTDDHCAILACPSVLPDENSELYEVEQLGDDWQPKDQIE